MKGEVYYGKGIRELEGENPDLYELVTDLNETVWNGKVLDYKTQKLIAIGITASRADPRATKKQMSGAAFSKALQILNSVVAAIEEEKQE